MVGRFHVERGVCAVALPAARLGGFGGCLAAGQHSGMAYRYLLALSLVVALCAGPGDDRDMLRAVARKEPGYRWRVDMLDVGHGLAMVIEQNGKGILYDTGDRWPAGSAAERHIYRC